MKRPSKKPIETLILTIRGQKVVLDGDLAESYGVPTKAFNQALKRNRDRFPEDFAFQLTAEEYAALRTPPAAADSVEGLPPASPEAGTPNWSQFVTSSRKHRGAAYRPWAFTEHGALMAANILRSRQAIEMSVFVIRACVRAREQLTANAAILKRLAEIDRSLLQHDTALRELYTKFRPLLAPPRRNRPARKSGSMSGKPQSRTGSAPAAHEPPRSQTCDHHHPRRLRHPAPGRRRQRPLRATRLTNRAALRNVAVCLIRSRPRRASGPQGTEEVTRGGRQPVP